MLKLLKKWIGGNKQESTSVHENQNKSKEIVMEQRITPSPLPTLATQTTSMTSVKEIDIVEHLDENTEKDIQRELERDIENDDTSLTPAPVMSDPTQRGFDTEFRLEDDERHVIRINQKQPQGFPKKIAEFITIAGITMENRDIVANQFAKGNDRQIELRKQPDNPYDKNAIEVYGHWTKQGKSFTEKLGYLPSKVASTLANEPELKATIKVIYKQTDETNVGIKIDVWTKMKKRVKVEEIPYVDMEIPHKAVDRNIKGQELEKEGYIDNAIELYELNIKEQFDGNFPYDRLIIIYRRRKMVEDEIRVLEQAVHVFEAISKKSKRHDVSPKLEKYREKLTKIKVPSN